MPNCCLLQAWHKKSEICLTLIISNEYPQSVFFSRNKKHNVYPCKLQFYYIKVGLRGSKLYKYVFVMKIEHTAWQHKLISFLLKLLFLYGALVTDAAHLYNFKTKYFEY